MPAPTKTATGQVFKQQVKLMGNQFELSAVGDDADWANTVIQAGIDEIEDMESIKFIMQ